MKRLFIGDDSEVLRVRLKDVVSEIEGIEVIGEEGNAKAVIKAINNLNPDVVILDIRMPGGNGISVLAEIIRGSSLFIGVDSGPAHISAALNVPTIILFSGINDPKQWAPRGSNVRIIYPGPGKDLSPVSPEQVCAAADEVLP